MNKILLHMEGFAVLLISVTFYFVSGFNWLLFIILLFAPDLSMLAYALGKKQGAVVYNVFHTYVVPAVFLMAGFLVMSSLFVSISLIWIAHIGMDRILGFGLKYPDDFKDTHLQRV